LNGEGTRTARVRAHVVGRSQVPSLLGHWNCSRVGAVAPRVHPSVVPLGGVLPLPFMGKALARPGGIRPRVLQRNPCNWLAGPSLRITAVLPILQEVMVVSRMIMAGVEKLLELRISHGIAI